MTKSLREQLIELGLASASSQSSSRRVQQDPSDRRGNDGDEKREARPSRQVDQSLHDSMRARSPSSAGPTLREQLIAEGRIKPVDTLLARDVALHNEVIAEDEDRRRLIERRRAEKSHKRAELATKKTQPKVQTGRLTGSDRTNKKFKCSVCGKWIPLGEGLKHEAMHKGIEYVPTSDVRPRSEGTQGATRSNAWVHVYPGGLPGLGKRN